MERLTALGYDVALPRTAKARPGMSLLAVGAGGTAITLVVISGKGPAT